MGRILILIIALLCTNTSAFAATSDPFLKDFVGQDSVSRWGALVARHHNGQPHAPASDLKDLQALSYLQGYDPAPLLKGVTVYDKTRAFPGYNLFLSADAPRATLMDMNGVTIHQWYYPSASLPLAQGYYDPYWCRAHIFKNGDLLALLPFGGLLKIDKNSHLLWFRKIICHHDFDIDSAGNIYTLTVRASVSGDTAGLKIDSITILSPDGEIKKELSLYDLFRKYPDASYIDKINASRLFKSPFLSRNGNTVNYRIPGDAFHSNSIQILDGKWASKIPAFKKGNILINSRSLATIICVDPDKEKIVWLMDRVFWDYGMHWAKLLDNGNIMLFDNHHNNPYGRDLLSRVVEFDPLTKKVAWDYSHENGRFYSLYLGQCFRLPNGNTLLVESTAGHAFEVTPDKRIVWEFYNPHQVDKTSGLINTDPAHLRPVADKYDKLIAVIYQMERIPLNSDLDWLKK